MKAISTLGLAVLCLVMTGSAQARKSSSGIRERRASSEIKANRPIHQNKGRVHNTKYYRPNHPRISKNPSPKRSAFNIQDWSR